MRGCSCWTVSAGSRCAGSVPCARMNREGNLLYVGRSGGGEGKVPDTWIRRLREAHLWSEWIGEAATVTVTSALTYTESVALEDALAPHGRYNILRGHYSGSHPEGQAGASAITRNYRYRATFRFDAFQVRQGERR